MPSHEALQTPSGHRFMFQSLNEARHPPKNAASLLERGAHGEIPWGLQAGIGLCPQSERPGGRWGLRFTPGTSSGGRRSWSGAPWVGGHARSQRQQPTCSTMIYQTRQLLKTVILSI